MFTVNQLLSIKKIYLYQLKYTLGIPVNLSDPHGRRSPAIENEKAGDLVRQLF